MDYAISKIKNEIKNLIAEAVDEEIDLAQIEITTPPQSDMGDFAVPCFYLSKLLRRSPNQIANDLKSKISIRGLVSSVQNVGPYLNFFVSGKSFNSKVLTEIAAKGEKYGQCKLGQEKVMIEYSQPNTHKEFHIGHLRNAVLGSSLVNLYRFSGYKVVAANYIGDIGTHVAKCLWALLKFHQGDEPTENKGAYLGKIYAEGATKAAENPEDKKEVDEVLQKLENGDKKLLALWKKTRKWSLDDFDRIYKILDIKFDKFFYESEVEKPGKRIVEDLLAKGLAEKSQGAVIIDLDKFGLKQFLLLKSDGSSLYSTKELALAELKFNKYKIDKSITLTDSRQNFYFQQFFKTLTIMGFDKQMVHLSYEFVTLKDGAMASRQGNVVLFEDFYKQVCDLAAAETKKRHEDWTVEKIEETAKKIALAAIKFNMLKVGSNSIIVFDVDEALSFEGFTGPYLQYTVSRINSILKKTSAKNPKDLDFSSLDSQHEKDLVLKLAAFPEAVADAVKQNQSSEMAKYIFELAKIFAGFYQNIPVLTAEEETKQARLALVSAVRQTMVNGLKLLGIDELEQM